MCSLRYQGMLILLIIRVILDGKSKILWFKLFQRAKPVIVDPGLYMSEKSDVFWITQRRSVPTAFKLFTGFCYGILFFYIESYLGYIC
ncbi:putative beta-glucuronosyltransferase GlcAT14A/B/C [Helianthus debilis subsp. tardiflorus]